MLASQATLRTGKVAECGWGERAAGSQFLDEALWEPVREPGLNIAHRRVGESVCHGPVRGDLAREPEIPEVAGANSGPEGFAKMYGGGE